MLDQPPQPLRYQVADDLDQPLAAVVAAAERCAATSPPTTAGTRASEPPMSAAGDYPDRDGHDGRHCGLFGCLELADWIITDPQGGQLAACDVDVNELSTTPSPGSHRAAASESGSGVPEHHSRSSLSRGAHIVSSSSVVRSH